MKIYDKLIIRTPLLALDCNIESMEYNESLYLASPVLYREMNKSTVDKKAKDKLKTEISKYKYFSRSKRRCTPYGLFGKVGTAKFGEYNQVIINSDSHLDFRKTKLDMGVLNRLVSLVSKYVYVKPYLLYRRNSSLYRIGNYYRFVEYYIENGTRKYKLSQVDFSNYLEEIIKLTTENKAISEIKKTLICDDISEDDAEAFINELIESQILVNNLDPNLTDGDYFDKIITILTNIYNNNPNEHLNSLNNLLSEISTSLNNIDTHKVNDVKNYHDVFEKLKVIIPDLSETNLFHVDSFRDFKSSTIKAEVKDVLLEAVNFLNKVTMPVRNPRVEKFKDQFLGKFEGKEVLLSLLFDTEIGLKYGDKENSIENQLIENLIIKKNISEYELKWNLLNSIMFRLLNKSIKNKETLFLNDDDFNGIDFSSNKLPNSMGLLFSYISEKDDLINLISVTGPSATCLLGRFGMGSSEIHGLLNEIVNFEKENDTYVYAEIIHLPEARIGNILSRPRLRENEIIFLGDSNAKNKILIDDIMVSVKNGKVFLRSVSLNKFIIPRMSNAHNFSNNSLSIYNFLCDLQSEYYEKSFLSLDIGPLKTEYDFIPRIQYKNVVLSPARWNFRGKEIKDYFADKSQKDSFHDFIQKNSLPNEFYLIEGDNKLFIDIKENISFEIFLDFSKNKDLVVVEESFVNDSCLVKNNIGQSYLNECVAILFNEEFVINFPNELLNPLELNTKRIFIPASEWLFIKIYCGNKTAEFILRNYINELSKELKNKDLINKLFFIRYNDLEDHIRVRFYLISPSCFQEVVRTVNNKLSEFIKTETISKISIETYIREIERYGNDSIEIIESIFDIDSFFVCSILKKLHLKNDRLRWNYALLTMNLYFELFNFNLDDKIIFCETNSGLFFNEHGASKELKISLDEKFRSLKYDLENLFNEHTEDQYINDLKSDVLEYKQNLKELFTSLNILLNQKEEKFKMNVYSSIIHMHLNRLFVSKQRTNEFVLYFLLARQFKSIKGRVNQLKKQNEESI